MAINTAGVVTAIQEVQTVSATVLATIEATDPGVAGEAATAGALVTLLGGLVSSALRAYSAASGTPVTVESVQALLPDPTPLNTPTL
jgi:hypothetical protein